MQKHANLIGWRNTARHMSKAVLKDSSLLAGPEDGAGGSSERELDSVERRLNGSRGAAASVSDYAGHGLGEQQ